MDQIGMHAFQKNLYWLTYRNDPVVSLRPYLGGIVNSQSLAGNLKYGGGLLGVTREGGMKTDTGRKNN